MTIEQSLKNIENLKNIVMPFGSKHIFFDFISETKFTLHFFDEIGHVELRKIIKEKYRTQLPSARIILDNHEHELLIYIDSRQDVVFNLTIGELVDYRNNDGLRQCSPNEVKMQMAKLVLKLKQG